MRKILYSIITNNSLGEEINQYIQEYYAQLGVEFDQDYPSCLIINFADLNYNGVDWTKLEQVLRHLGVEYIFSTIQTDKPNKFISINSREDFENYKSLIHTILNEYHSNKHLLSGFFVQDENISLDSILPEEFVGIVGGAGFIATLHFCHMILNHKLPYIAIYDSFAPNPTKSILAEQKEIVEHYKRDIILLKNSCKLLIMPCNTIHYFFEELFAVSSNKLHSIILIVRDYIENNQNHINQLAVLGTQVTLQFGFFNNIQGYNNVIINDSMMVKLQQSIRLVKENKLEMAKNNLLSIIYELRKQYQEEVKFLFGCTELNVPFQDEAEIKTLSIISSAHLLADAVKSKYYINYFKSESDEILQD